MTGKLGPPPPTLQWDRADLTEYEGDLWRVHQLAAGRPAWNQLRHYGPVPKMRFDPHEPPPGAGKAEGVQYTATRALEALAETFQDRRRIPVGTSSLRLVGWRPTRPLTLVDVNGMFAVKNGGAATLAAGPKRFTQAWGRAIGQQVPGIDGLWHRSAMTGGDLVTLFIRSEHHPVWPAAPAFNRTLNDSSIRGFLLAAARRLGYTLG